MKTLAVDYRRITESLPQDLKKALKMKNIKQFVSGYSLVFLGISLFVLSLYAVILVMNYTSAREAWLAARDNFTYWESVALTQKNSPDAYYQAALYAAELQRNDQAVQYLDKAVELDPGFSGAKELRKQISNF